jgi:hypothetical protein
MKRVAIICVSPVVMAASIFAAPHIFYSDLESGPNTGGPNNAGAFVTIEGSGFGYSQGSSYVSIGGGKAAAYLAWNDHRISFQLGPAAATGGIVVTTAAGDSNSIRFTVRAGRILIIPAGKSKGIQKGRDSMQPGDITYVRDGYIQSTDDDWNSCFVIGGKSGKPGLPIALLAYPGENVTIGSLAPTAKGGCDSAIRSKGQGETDWVIAGLHLVGALAMTLYAPQRWRLIGNDMTCPNGNGAAGCLSFGPSSQMVVYGNNIHDAGISGASALYHGVYMADGTVHVDFGWNTVANVQGCRGIQLNSSSKQDLADIQIHDNTIHDTQCDGIVMTTVDPTQPGGIKVWNNVIYNTGKGPTPPEGSGAFFCLNVQGYTSSGTARSGTVEVYNNTMYNCGSWTKPPYSNSNGGVAMTGPFPEKHLHLSNNIICPAGHTPHLLSDPGRIFGSNNFLCGNGRPGFSDAGMSQSIRGDPKFVGPDRGDFHLRSDSPARGSGIDVGITTDKDGLSRDRGKPSMGAYQ